MYDLKVVNDECENLLKKIDVSKLKNQKVLITGASGLIGSFFADYLNFLNEKLDYKIKIYLTSFGSLTGAERIKHLINKENIIHFTWDASTPIDEKKIVGVNYVFFCSGYGQPTKFTKDNVKTAFINTVGLNSLLQYLEKVENGNLLFISSSEIYGDPDESNIPTKESYNGNYSIENNRASYICSKRLGEIICLQYLKKVNVKIARVGLIYGPGTLFNDDRVLQSFIFKANKDKKISMLDSGSAIRNYLYLTDGIEILFNIFLNGKDPIYNVGGDTEPVSILELANLVASNFNCIVEKGTDLNNNLVKNSPKNVYMSMEKYKKEFPNSLLRPIKLKNGIKNVILWYKF
jgi:dTDP-glucose 4,6-dehydratase/UDP-glucuronate decarboxylase